MEKPLPLLALTATLALASCAHQPRQPAVQLPPGVDGYQCYRRQEMTNGYVYAEGYPDYRGGFRSHTMSWVRKERDTEITLVWNSGPETDVPPGWLNISQSVRAPITPLHTKMHLKLSSGEVHEKEFIEPRDWRRYRRMTWVGGYGGSIFTTDSTLIDAFTKAEWADVDVVAPDGTGQAHIRIDLAELPHALEVMRRLGEEVHTAIADYEHLCAPIHIEVDYF